MTQIDLLPQDLLPLKNRRRLKITLGTKGMISTFVFSGLIFTAAWIGLSAEVNKKTAELSGIEEQWRKIDPLLKQAAELGRQKKALEDSLTVLESFFDREFLWSEKLDQIRKIIPDGIWLTRLSLEKGQKESRFLRLKGTVTSLNGENILDTITDFAGEIRENQAFFKDFPGLELRNLKKSNIRKANIMTFEIILPLNPDFSLEKSARRAD